MDLMKLSILKRDLIDKFPLEANVFKFFTHIKLTREKNRFSSLSVSSWTTPRRNIPEYVILHLEYGLRHSSFNPDPSNILGVAFETVVFG